MSAACHTVYLNVEIVAASTARLPIDDPGVAYGLGFFETFRTSGGRPHHWPHNLRRLECACATAGLAIPPHFLAADEPRLRDIVQRLLQAHGLDDAVFRYTLAAANRGAAEFLTLRPLPPPAPPEGIALRLLELARDNGEFLPRPKSLNYSNALLGAGELARRSAPATDEGLFLSREGGFVVETPRQNLAWFADGELRHPDPLLGAVAGTCLDWLLETAGSPAVPRRAPLDELLAADAIFVCNAVRGITPVRTLWAADDRTLLRRFASAADPHVLAFRAAWEDSLRTTAVQK
jgi:4-amino-4-deoxychorismate lyase